MAYPQVRKIIYFINKMQFYTSIGTCTAWIVLLETTSIKKKNIVASTYIWYIIITCGVCVESRSEIRVL